MSRLPHEDVYDFDHVFDEIKDQMVEGENYVFDKRGRLVRQGRKKYSQEGIIKLPKMPVGQSRSKSRSVLRPVTTDKNIRTPNDVQRNIEHNVLDGERTRPNDTAGQRQRQEVGSYSSERDRATLKNNTGYGSLHVPAPPTQPSNTSFSRRRHSHVTDAGNTLYGRHGTVTPSSHSPVRHPADDIYQTSSIRQHGHTEFENIHVNDLPTRIHVNQRYGSTVHAPTPPTMKPSEYPSYSRTNRKVKYSHDEGDMYEDVDDDTKSIRELGKRFEESSAKLDLLIKECERHFVGDGSFEPITDATADVLLEELDEMMKSPSPDYVKTESRKPKQKRPAFDDELSADINEILKSPRNIPTSKPKLVKNKKENDYFFNYQQPIGKSGQQNSKKDETDELIKEIDDLLNQPSLLTPTSVTATESSTPVRRPAGVKVTRMTTEPLKQWNGETAKRGVGFKSKLRKEAVKVRRPEIDVIPDRVRRRMEECLKTTKKS